MVKDLELPLPVRALKRLGCKIHRPTMGGEVALICDVVVI